MQLVDVQTGFALWSKSYSTKYDDVLAMQNNISLVVASQLEILLTPDVRQALAKSPTDNVAAYDYYTQANEYLLRPLNFENVDLAASLYQKAIDVDPDFALGYAGLCKSDLRRFLLSSDTSIIPKAEESCRKALTLDKTLSEVHSTLGSLYLATDRPDAARDAFETALDLDARSIDAFVGIGRLFMREGNFVDAEARLNAAVVVRPGNWRGYEQLGYLKLLQGKFEEAAEHYGRVLELSPDNANALNSLGAINYYLGNFLVAAERFEQSIAVNPTREALSNTGTMYYYAGDYVQAAHYFHRAVEEVPTDYRLWGNLADALRFIDGEKAQALSLYQKAIDMALAEVEVTGHTDVSLANLAWYHANLGVTDSAASFIEETNQLETLEGQTYYTIALTHALLGNATAAQAAIIKAKAMGIAPTMLDAAPELRGIDAGDAANARKARE